MYETPDIGKLNDPTMPTGESPIYENELVLIQDVIASVNYGITIQVVFQIDTTLPLSVDPVDK